jgi:choline/ethanolamine kinase
VLLRVYGQGVDQFIDREREISLLSKLSVCNVGPKLLGIFKNGRFEQYYDSITLTHEMIRNSDTSRHIASRMCELHNIVNIYPAPKNNIPEIWKNVDKWLPSAEEAYKTSKRIKSSDSYSVNFAHIRKTLPLLKKTIQSLCSPIVFCHNDVSLRIFPLFNYLTIYSYFRHNMVISLN